MEQVVHPFQPANRTNLELKLKLKSFFTSTVVVCQSDQSGIETGDKNADDSEEKSANRTNLELKQATYNLSTAIVKAANRTNLELKRFMG